MSASKHHVTTTLPSTHAQRPLPSGSISLSVRRFFNTSVTWKIIMLLLRKCGGLSEESLHNIQLANGSL
eukprot:12894508-Prorocentrum_lima.AAC.1